MHRPGKISLGFPDFGTVLRSSVCAREKLKPTAKALSKSKNPNCNESVCKTRFETPLLELQLVFMHPKIRTPKLLATITTTKTVLIVEVAGAPS